MSVKVVFSWAQYKLTDMVFAFASSQSYGIFKPKIVGRFPIQIPEIYFSKGKRSNFLLITSSILPRRCTHFVLHGSKPEYC